MSHAANSGVARASCNVAQAAKPALFAIPTAAIRFKSI
jgi:hypothetical protein